MKYIKSINLPDEKREKNVLCNLPNLYSNYYPFHLFPQKKIKEIKFSDTTIINGNYGTCKTTLLNIIYKKLTKEKNNDILFNKYVEKCLCDLSSIKPAEIKLINSNSIYNELISIRNNKNNQEKIDKANDYLNNMLIEPLTKEDQLKRKEFISLFVDEEYNRNISNELNLETSLIILEKKIKDNSIYILEEPENYLSPESQMKLVKFINDAVRFFNCQFIIATHSPFLLKIDNSIIYNIDNSIETKKADQLEDVKAYLNI